MNTSIDLTAFNKLYAKVNSDYVYITIMDVINTLPFDGNTLRLGEDTLIFKENYDTFVQGADDWLALYLNGKEFFFADKPHKHAETMNIEATRLYNLLSKYFKEGAVMATNTFNIEELFNRSSYSVKQLQAIGLELGFDKEELDRQLISINKTMIGKEMVVDTLIAVGITLYADALGVYSPDQLIKDIEKFTETPTYNGERLTHVLKHIWSSVSPSLHVSPKGHQFVKELIVHVQKELGSKVSTGNKQMRTCIKMKTLELFKDFN